MVLYGTCETKEKLMHYRYHDIFFGTAMLLIGALLFMHTYDSQYLDLLTNNAEHTSTMLYARIVLGGWCFMGTCMCVQALLRKVSVDKNYNWKSILVVLAMILAMLVGISIVGFIISASLFFFCFAVYLGFKNKAVAAIMAVGISILIFYIFDKAMGIILPAPFFAWGV